MAKIDPAIVFIQETKNTFPDKQKLPGYKTFERIRTNQKEQGGGAGGVLIAAKADLNPKLKIEHYQKPT